MNSGYAKSVISGLTWQYASLVVKAIAQIIVIAILSRLLTPEEFGLLSIALIFTNLAMLISQMGVGPALVQRQHISEDHIRVGVTLSMVFGIMMLGGLWLLSPTIAHFFDKPSVQPVLKAVGFSFVFMSVGVVSQSLLQRHLQFKKMMWIEVISYLLGYATTGIVMALLGFGVWALVGAQIGQSLVFSILSFKVASHPIRPLIRYQETKDLLVFGFGFTMTRLFNYFAGQGDNFVVGKMLGTIDLGLYSRAHQLMMLPAQYVGMALEKVLFPVISKLQNDIPKMRLYFFVNNYVICLATAPLSVLMYICAPDIVKILLGAQWDGVIQPFQFLSLGVLFRTAYKIGDSVAKATGAVYQRSVRELIYAGCVIGGAFIGSHWGLSGVSIGILIAIILNYVMVLTMSRRILDFGWLEFLQSQIPGFFYMTIVAVIAIPARLLLNSINASPLVALILTVLLVLSVIGTILFLFPQTLGSYGAITFTTIFQFLPSNIQSMVIFKRFMRYFDPVTDAK